MLSRGKPEFSGVLKDERNVVVLGSQQLKDGSLLIFRKIGSAYAYCNEMQSSTTFKISVFLK